MAAATWDCGGGRSRQAATAEEDEAVVMVGEVGKGSEEGKDKHHTHTQRYSDGGCMGRGGLL